LTDFISKSPFIALDLETFNYTNSSNVPRPIKFNGMFEGGIKTIQIGFPLDVCNLQFIIDIEELLAKGLTLQYLGSKLKVLEKATILGQNLKYEFQFLSVYFHIRLRKFRDVMLMSQVLLAGDKIKHNLASLYNEYISQSEFKALTGKDFAEYAEFKATLQKSRWRGTLTADQLQYAADDVKLVFPLYDNICERLDEFVEKYEQRVRLNQTIYNAIKLECDLIPTYAMMELRGIGYDKTYHQTIVIPFLEEKRKEAEDQVAKYFVREVIKSNGLRGKARVVWTDKEVINLSSPIQIKTALNGAGVSVSDSREETLKKHISDHPALPWILQYKKADSLLDKFGEKMLNLCSRDSIIHANWYQIGSDEGSIDTGRSSCQGPNLQQTPARENIFGKSARELFRKSFKARPGYIFIDVDYKQVEPRVTAQICNEKAMLEAFNKDIDLYSAVAKKWLNLDYLPERGDYKRDFIGKTGYLALSYKAGPMKLRDFVAEESKGEIVWTDLEAKEYWNSFFASFPGIARKQNEIDQFIRKKPEGFSSLAPFKGRKPITILFTELGRPRRWCLKPEQERMLDEDLHKFGENQRWNTYQKRLNEISREGYNFIIQGTAADILKVSLKLIQDRFEAAGFDFETEGVIAVVHDELLIEVKEEHQEEASKIVEACMIEAGQRFIDRLPVGIDLKIGHNWAEVH